jgi:uncharacterized membrane-anchored protein
MVSKSYSSNSPFGQVFTAAVQAVENCGWDITEKDEKEGRIVVRTEMSLLSWGEEIVIELSKRENKTLMNVSSEPISQLFDSGKSSKNLEKFIRNLKKVE